MPTFISGAQWKVVVSMLAPLRIHECLLVHSEIQKPGLKGGAEAHLTPIPTP